MPRSWPLLAGLTCASALLAAQAHAQPLPPTGPAPFAPPVPPPAAPVALPAAPPAPPPSSPETLETPYEDTPPPAPQAPRLPPPPPPGDIQLQVPAAQVPRAPLATRARRKLALTGEVGWNGLAGFGPVLTYYPNPHFALDLGAGMSLLGWKAGVRGRYNFMTTPMTPFLGVGFNATSGLGEFKVDPSEDPDGDPNRQPVTINVKPSYVLQGVLGFDFIHKHGFTLVGCIGYARVLNENVEVLAGSFTENEQRGIDIGFKSGPVVTLAAGYAFE